MLTLDRLPESAPKSAKRAEARFNRARKVERRYAAKLRGVARYIGMIVDAFAPEGVVADLQTLMDALERYAQLLTPWAEAVAKAMITEVSRKDERAWKQQSKEIGKRLSAEIEEAPTGKVMREKLQEQVGYITSLPRDAAQRVHKLTTEAATQGRRAEDIAKEIARSGKVSESRAMLIARTEVGRTATALEEARARHVGSTHYIWRTADDSDVREIHRKLNGTIHSWDDPPVSGENGERSHPGAIYNCRCYPEPIIPR